MSAGELSLSVLRQRVAERTVTARFDVKIRAIPLVRHTAPYREDSLKAGQYQPAIEVLVMLQSHSCCGGADEDVE